MFSKLCIQTLKTNKNIDECELNCKLMLLHTLVVCLVSRPHPPYTNFTQNIE